MDDITLGHGPVIMAVDNLPCEFPRKSSEAFAEALMPYLPHLCRIDLEEPDAVNRLSRPLQPALTVRCGSLMPDYAYFHQRCKRLLKQGRQRAKAVSSGGEPMAKAPECAQGPLSQRIPSRCSRTRGPLHARETRPPWLHPDAARPEKPTHAARNPSVEPPSWATVRLCLASPRQPIKRGRCTVRIPS
ncbi:hypothetical protein [Desulfosoma sp.]|uniref:hypothetical protein n=1 Tax=Desulfosoma sp. TaxID=2603217 RepID=UPI00404B37E0